jgi:hypothetical protein
MIGRSASHGQSVAIVLPYQHLMGLPSDAGMGRLLPATGRAAVAEG